MRAAAATSNKKQELEGFLISHFSLRRRRADRARERRGVCIQICVSASELSSLSIPKSLKRRSAAPRGEREKEEEQQQTLSPLRRKADSDQYTAAATAGPGRVKRGALSLCARTMEMNVAAAPDIVAAFAAAARVVVVVVAVLDNWWWSLVGTQHHHHHRNPIFQTSPPQQTLSLSVVDVRTSA